VLSALPMPVLSHSAYEKRFHALQRRIYEAHRKAREIGLSTVLAFEGWDAAGKGGAIRRLSYALNARNYKIIPISAPTDEEKAHHYLWRFWRQLQRAGHMTIFDRTWYGRVLVERVDKLIPAEVWTRAYGEINAFEKELRRNGTLLLKFWIHITRKEQRERFEKRADTPYKRWKLTPDDWHNRKKWDDYEAAVNDMVAQTSTETAPWHLVSGNDKHYARIQVLEILADALDAALAARGYKAVTGSHTGRGR
jgi:polyphosphate kinase 2 (PPK2 family)